MVINPDIKKLFNSISTQSVHYANSPDKERKYIRRLLRVFKSQLTEEEQLFLIKSLLESISYRSIVTDPDNIIQIHNIKLRTYTFLFFLFCLGAILVSALFKTNESIGSMVEFFSNVFKILSI